MLRNTIAILLIIAFTVQSFSKVFLVANYYANKAAFVKSCVNRATPKMNCKGHCLLMKKIEAQQHKEEKNPELKLENKNEVYIVSKHSFYYSDFKNHLVVYAPVRSIGYPLDFSSPIFRPPLS